MSQGLDWGASPTTAVHRLPSTVESQRAVPPISDPPPRSPPPAQVKLLHLLEEYLDVRGFAFECL